MSISSHLTNEPERQLRIFLDTMEASVDRSDRRIAALTVFAAGGAAFASLVLPEGTQRLAALVPLAAALPLGVLGYSPMRELAGWYCFLDPSQSKSSSEECLPLAEHLAKYSHSELTNRLEKYLGGGVVATQYYEDLVTQIGLSARAASRKQTIFRILSGVVGIGQLALSGLLVFS